MESRTPSTIEKMEALLAKYDDPTSFKISLPDYQKQMVSEYHNSLKSHLQYPKASGFSPKSVTPKIKQKRRAAGKRAKASRKVNRRRK